jgi:hypothetical protein
MKKSAVLILLTIQLLSCVPVESDQKPTPTPNVEVTEALENTATMKMGGAVIIYQRSGGFVGISEEWTFYPDGRIISIDETEYNLPAEQVMLLLDEIESLGFFDMSDSGSLFSNCRDCFSYHLTVRSGEQFNSISMVDGASDTPDQLWEIVEKIDKVLRSLVD